MKSRSPSPRVSRHDLPATRGGLESVQNQIQQGLFELETVGDCRRRARLPGGQERHTMLGAFGTHERDKIRKQRTNRKRFPSESRRSSIAQKLRYEGVELVKLVRDRRNNLEDVVRRIRKDLPQFLLQKCRD